MKKVLHFGISLLLCGGILLLGSSGFLVSAHFTGTLLPGTEESGWIALDHHNQDAHLTYRLADDYSKRMEIQLAINQGAQAWYPYGGNIERNTSSVNYITSTNDPNSSAIATTYSRYYTTTKHLADFYIVINRAHESVINSRGQFVFAHEFGHAFGLSHVTASYNMNALMFPDDRSTVNAPNAYKDVKGFKQLSGLHSSHEVWLALDWKASPNQHYIMCRDCNGIKLNGSAKVTEYCSFTVKDSNGNFHCSKCNKQYQG